MSLRDSCIPAIGPGIMGLPDGWYAANLAESSSRLFRDTFEIISIQVLNCALLKKSW